MEKNQLILQGDCYQLLKEMEPGSVDLILTDPPYVLNADSTGTFKGAKLYGSDNFREICSGYDVPGFLELCARVCKKMNCFVFCSNSQIPKIMQWALDRKYYATLLGVSLHISSK